MGRASRRKGRAIHGIVLLDKPTGITSNAALQRVKRLFNAKKAGHTGSLDPMASGLLPICLGEATKLSSYLLDSDKQYQFTCKFGEKTNTADADGEVIAQNALPSPTAAQIATVLPQFLGVIEQIPPMYSALHHEGKRLYELAREGVEVERPARQVTISALELLAVDGQFATFTVRCSKGTYVRTLAEDIAAALNTYAHLTVLRRTGVGNYALAEAVTLAQLQALHAEMGENPDFTILDQHLAPLNSTLLDWPAVTLSAEALFYARQGNPVQVSHAPAAGWLRMLNEAGELIGLAEMAADGRVAPRRVFCLE